MGSASLTTDAGGNRYGQLRYYPYGVTRYTWGNTPTDRRFTGQRSEEAGLGSLYDYGARIYSPVLARFISADTDVPKSQDPQSLNRYAYGLNNPVKYLDPSGHNGVPFWVPFMAAAADSLQSIGDPARNPRTAAFNHAVSEGVSAWGDVAKMYAQTVDYTKAAVSEGRWGDAARGAQATAQENLELAKAGAQAGGQFVVGAVTTPIRFVASDIPELLGAASERMQGQDRTWDVLFTGATAAGDVTAMYYMSGARARYAQSQRGGTVSTKPSTGQDHHPPGWNQDWQLEWGSRGESTEPHWWDPDGGEWRWHPADKWHPVDHWDYNPWTEWNSKWQNIPPKE